jgi:hypothetical protein
MTAVSRPARSEGEPLPTGLFRVTVYFLPDSTGYATGSRDLDPAPGRLFIKREVACPQRQADLDQIEVLRVQYENPGLSPQGRDRVKAAAGDYAASWVDGQWGVTWWETPQSFPLSRAADVLDGSAEWLYGVVEHSIADAGSRAWAAGPLVDIGSGIAANFVTAPLTRPLENAALICEVAGIVVGLATGIHPLVIACAKRLAHDGLRREIGRGFEQIIGSPHAGRERTAGRTRGTRALIRGRHPARLRNMSSDRVQEPGTGRRPSADRARPAGTSPVREPGTGRRPSADRARPAGTSPVREPGTGRRPSADRARPAGTSPVEEPRTDRRLDRSRSLGRADPGRGGYPGRGGR